MQVLHTFKPSNSALYIPIFVNVTLLSARTESSVTISMILSSKPDRTEAPFNVDENFKVVLSDHAPLGITSAFPFRIKTPSFSVHLVTFFSSGSKTTIF